MSIKRIRKFLKENERYLSPLALFVGFIFDNFTLTRIDLWYSNLVLFSYIIVAGIGITLVHLYEDKIIKGYFIKKIEPFLPFLIQFVFGGLFSGYFIFYSRSAPFVTSWFFILLLLSLLVGNEFFKKHYRGLVFQVSIFYFSLFSFTIFYVPVVIEKMGAIVFLLSGFVSLIVMTLLLFALSLVIPKRVKEKGRILAISILCIFLSINFLYFTNIIPPVPLSLKDAGVYHFVGKNAGGGYVVRSEEKKWYELGVINEKIHIKRGSPVYLYSAVFAPTYLNTIILHKWQYYDEKKEEWIALSRIRLTVVGGRDGGYRGYSVKENVFPGKWRVDITTGRGQVLGRVSFEIVYSNFTPTLNTELK